MWPWSTPWRVWAAVDLWPRSQPAVRTQAMHFSYEKSGLLIEGQPIPWNADAVIVECLAKLPASALGHQGEFRLRVPGQEPVPLDGLRRDEASGQFRLFFRALPPKQTTNAEVIWRHHRLSEIALPVIQRSEFLSNLRLQNPTLAVLLGQSEQAVACQAFVTSQSKGVFASALLSSPTNLAPLADMDFHLEWRLAKEENGRPIRFRLSSSQLKAKQALLMVCATHRPKRAGSYAASWVIDGQVLAVQGIKANTLSQFHRSLRISESRLVCQTSTGNVRLVRGKLSLQGVARVGPCFLISSGEVGIAACCRLSVCAQMANGSKSPVLLEEELLVTDGPTPFVPGTLAAREVAEMRAFEVFVGTRSLGIVPLTDAPVAAFDSEGGFKTVPQYSWSIAAEDQLQEKLAKLLEPHGNGK